MICKRFFFQSYGVLFANKNPYSTFADTDFGMSLEGELMGALPESDLPVSDERGVSEFHAYAAWVVMTCAAGVLIILLAAAIFGG